MVRNRGPSFLAKQIPRCGVFVFVSCYTKIVIGNRLPTKLFSWPISFDIALVGDYFRRWFVAGRLERRPRASQSPHHRRSLGPDCSFAKLGLGGEGNLQIEVDKKLEGKFDFRSNGVSSRPTPEDKLKQYATLFYQKTEKYFKKTNGVMLGDAIITKVIRMTADNLNQKEQVVLNKSALLSCELDDLLK